MSIQEFSRVTGMSSHTLRYYERAGLMPRVERNASGHRRDGERHERWVGFLRHLRVAGMSIATIRRYVALLDQGRTGDAQRMALLREHREDLASRLEQLKHHVVAINQSCETAADRMSNAPATAAGTDAPKGDHREQSDSRTDTDRDPALF